MSDARNKLAVSFRAAVLEKPQWLPVAQPPTEGHITIVYGENRTAVARLKGGEWLTEKNKPLPFVPSHWMGFRDA